MKPCHSASVCQVCDKRMQHRKVININNNYKFLLLEAVVATYKPVFSVLMKACHCTSVYQVW